MKSIKVVITFVMLGTSLICAAKNVRFTNGEYPPYCSEKLLYYGLSSHIVSEAFAQEGFTVEYGFFPWKRSIVLVENGEWDGTLAFSKTPERLQKLQFSETPIGDVSVVLFYRKDYKFDWKTVEDLQGHKIGVMQGYATAEEMEQFKKVGGKVTVEYATTEVQNFKKLLANRIDIFPVVEEVATKVLHDNFTQEEINKLTTHPIPFKKKQLYVVFSKKIKQPEILYQAFERGMKKLKQSGRYNQIMEDYANGK